MTWLIKALGQGAQRNTRHVDTALQRFHAASISPYRAHGWHRPPVASAHDPAELCTRHTRVQRAGSDRLCRRI